MTIIMLKETFILPLMLNFPEVAYQIAKKMVGLVCSKKQADVQFIYSSNAY